MIRITDIARVGPALGELCALLGYSRPDLARIIAAATGRPAASIANQLGAWDRLEGTPTVRSLGPILDALGYDLALVPREEKP
jgi:hypothetical protein